MISLLKNARPIAAVEPADGAPAAPVGAPPAVLALRQEVLRALATEYRPIRAIPHRWPVQRSHVRRVVRQLWREGLLERRPGPGGPDRWLYRAARAEAVTRA